MMGTTALGYLIAWGPFASLCIWEMITEPSVSKATKRKKYGIFNTLLFGPTSNVFFLHLGSGINLL